MFHVKQRRKMASKRRNTKPNRRERGRRRRVLPALLLAAMVIGGFFGWMRLNASLTRLEFADVYLSDLPSQFDGSRIIFISDLNISSSAEAKSCIRMMEDLSQLDADMLILGGDYSAGSIVDSLNGLNGNEIHAIEFISALKDFPARLGKFAVSGENDDENIAAALANAGVQHLSDACAAVEKNGDTLVIAGLSDVSQGRTPYEQIGGYFSGDECVIAVAHNPAAYVGVRVAEARGGGAWADMVLSGHTLGGQINILGRNLRNLPEEEARCIAGWYYGEDIPLLVSQGLGCRDIKLRLGSRSEVWCITLRRPRSGAVLPEL